MEYRELGKTGLRVSRMGFGGIPIQRIDEEGTKTLFHKLLEQGVNYIDTARAYTVSEAYIGYALEGIREHFVLATKSMAHTREAMEQDIATLENNMGFFARTKNADSMIADVKKKISIAKEELARIEEKIRIIDNQFE